MDQPSTIKESEEAGGRRWTVENGRPLVMRIGIGFVAPIVLLLIGLTMINDVSEHRWGMLAMRSVFALVVAVSAVFSLFGAETLTIAGGEIVWRRGNSQVRRAAVADVEKLERQGNHLRVHVRTQPGEEPRPIVVGAGLRQQPSAIAWLAKRVEAAITATRRDK
ncbi:MAG TPA: hypothetical protein VGL86_10880 [Polyangia bacterium]|jgi:hypothetical protein